MIRDNVAFAINAVSLQAGAQVATGPGILKALSVQATTALTVRFYDSVGSAVGDPIWVTQATSAGRQISLGEAAIPFSNGLWVQSSAATVIQGTVVTGK